MRLSATARRERILASAQRLFARQGFQGTTTREIAERAGITEAMVFRHFRSKEALYWAVLEETIRSRRVQERLRGMLEAHRGDEELFAALAEDLLRRSQQDFSMTRLLLYSGLENHKLSHRFFRSYISGYYELLANWIRERMDAGEFRRMDPVLAARGFLGMVNNYALVQNLFGGAKGKDFDAVEVSRTLTEIWLAGMRRPKAHRNGHNGHDGNGSKNGNHRVRKKS